MKQVYINHFTMSITASRWSRSCCGHSHTVVSYRYCLCCSPTAMACVWLSMLLIFFMILIRHIYESSGILLIWFQGLFCFMLTFPAKFCLDL